MISMIILLSLLILLWAFTATAARMSSCGGGDGWRSSLSLQSSYDMPTSNFFNLHSMPRCGGNNDTFQANNNDKHRDYVIASLEKRVKELEIEIERLSSNSNNNNERRIPTQTYEEEKKKVPIPKQIVNVARNLFSIGRFRRRNTNRQQKLVGSTDITKEEEEAYIDHSFDDLDRIIENATDEDIPTNNNNNINNEEGYHSTRSWKNYKRREGSTIQVWMNKFISKETINAISTIKSIILKFPDYGVVDIFMYSPKDVIKSIVALSKLQHVILESSSSSVDTSSPSSKTNETMIVDKQLIQELAHYCKFANAAYGWKGFAFCGIGWHPFGGNNRMLIRSTGISKHDIVTTNWHSKANRPAYYIVRDTNRRVIVLGIRGSLSPRDCLTDLCASCENFLVEDVIGNIADDDSRRADGSSSDANNNNATIPPLIVGCGHKGMVHSARNVGRMTGKIISDELEKHEDYSLVIVGHSMGGGVAAILCAMWNRRFKGRVKSIGYGSPCVFPLNNTRSFDNIISVQGSGDPITKVSLGHLADMTKAVSKLCLDTSFRDEILKHTTKDDMSPADYEWCVNAMNYLHKQMDSEKLLPPGELFDLSGPLLDLPTDLNITGLVVDEGDTLPTTLTPVDASTFNELGKLHARMFDLTLHIPVRYDMLLRRLASSSDRV